MHFPACEHSGNAYALHCRCDFAFLTLSCYGRFLRLLLASLTVHDHIFLFVQIEQSVQLVQTGHFYRKLFLLREGVLNLLFDKPEVV